MSTIFARDGFGKQDIKTHAERRHRNGHQEGQADQRPDLSLFVEYPGKRHPQSISEAKKDRGPEYGATDVLPLDPASRGNGEQQADHACHGTKQADLQPAGAQTGCVDIQEIYGRAAEHPEPCNVQVQVVEVRSKLFGDFGLLKQAKTHKPSL